MKIIIDAKQRDPIYYLCHINIENFNESIRGTGTIFEGTTPSGRNFKIVSTDYPDVVSYEGIVIYLFGDNRRMEHNTFTKSYNSIQELINVLKCFIFPFEISIVLDGKVIYTSQKRSVKKLMEYING